MNIKKNAMKLVFFTIIMVMIVPLLNCSSVHHYEGIGYEYNENIQQLRILNVSTDPNYKLNGIVRISFVPISDKGNVILESNLDIKIFQKTPESFKIKKYIVNKPLINDKPWAFVINLDSSGSMSSNDPKMLRKNASKYFVELIRNNSNLLFNSDDGNKFFLKAGLNSLFAVSDFGAGTTEGFSNSRLLVDFTNNKEKIYDGIDKVEASGGTPLFESTFELEDYLIREISSEHYNKSILVLSDGEPNSNDLEPDVIKKAKKNNIRINTVALGSGRQNKIMHNLSLKTGGIYISADRNENLLSSFESVAIAYNDGYIELLLVANNPVNHYPSRLDNGTIVYPNDKNSFCLTVSSGETSASTTISIKPYEY